MHPRSPARRAVGVIAAYLLALQPILAGVAALPWVDAATLCLAAGHDATGDQERLPPSVPPDHAGCPACALSCGSAAPPLRSQAIADRPPTLSFALPWRVAEVPGVAARSHRGEARAPPA